VNQPKWFIIAKNEYRLMTSGSLLLRRALPYLLVGSFAVLVFILGPAFFDLIKSDWLVLVLSQAALSTIAIILLTFFFYFMVIPVTNTLKEEQASELEIFLSAPVRPEEVLIGKFMSKLVVYGTLAAIIAGLFAAAFTILGINIVQMMVIVLTIFLLLVSGLWIGTVIAAVVRTKLGRSARGKDIGKGLSIIIALPLLGLMYALFSGMMFSALENPSTADLVEMILALFPTTWGADILVSYANFPGSILPSETLVPIAIPGVIIFTIASFLIGKRVVAKAYSLEPTSFSSSSVKKDGSILRFIRWVTGSGQFSVMVITMFKDWGRRLENLSKVGYVVGLVFLLTIFFTRPEGPTAVIILLTFMIGLLAAFVVGEVTIRGKEMLFIYRKAPWGEKRLVWARLIQGWFIVIPITALIVIIMLAFIPGLQLIEIMVYLFFLVQMSMAITVFALGLFLVMPAFSEKTGEMVLNMMGTMLFFFILFVLGEVLFGQIGIVFFYMPVSWVVSLSVLYLGLRNLSRIE
jgi:hypothetical protein